MKSYIDQLDLESISNLPDETALLQKCTEIGVKAIPVNEMEIKIELDEDKISITDFLNMVKDNSGILYYLVVSYSQEYCLITADDIDEADKRVLEVLNTLTLNTAEELAYALDDYNDELYSEETLPEEDKPAISDYLSDLLDEDDDEEEEEFKWEDEICGVGKDILSKLKDFNHKVPKDCSIYTKSIMLCTVIDTTVIGLCIENINPIDKNLIIAEIVSPYIRTDFKRCSKQIEQEQQEKALAITQQQNELKEKLSATLKADKKFALCTNQNMRKQFARELKNNPEYSEILAELKALGVSIYDTELYNLLDIVYKQIK